MTAILSMNRIITEPTRVLRGYFGTPTEGAVAVTGDNRQQVPNPLVIRLGDFTLIAPIAEQAQVLVVSTKSPYQTLAVLVKTASRHPCLLKFAPARILVDPGSEMLVCAFSTGYPPYR